MPIVQISDDLKDIIDRLVADGVVGSGTEFVEQAVRLYATDIVYDDDELIAAAEAGLADMRAGDYTTIDGPESRTAFWDRIGREVRGRTADLRSNAARKRT
jgi:Arc/MetJ-type ribon-helix-helix transcriptional regulator